MDISIALSVAGLLATLILGILPLIVIFKKGELRFSRCFPFIGGPFQIDSSSQLKKQFKKHRLRRILIPGVSVIV